MERCTAMGRAHTAGADIIVVNEGELAPEQESSLLKLALECFPDVTAEEVEEDFCRPAIARALAYSSCQLVGGAEVFMRQVVYEGLTIVVGGFGPFVREDMRGRGIGTAICTAVMNYLKEQGCDVAFLSVDTGTETHRFYERLGFRTLAGPFIYANARGELKEEYGGMVAPSCSAELFETVLHGEAQFTLTPEAGYW